MNMRLRLILVAATPLLLASIWMDDQQSFKPYKPPILTPPADSVPISGKETITQKSELKNPIAATGKSVSLGKDLFETNCALCHGSTSVERGPVGKKLMPPPPGLDHSMIDGLGDSTIFKAITFGFGRMPVFQDKLLPDERWHIVNFLHTRK